MISQYITYLLQWGKC